MYRDVSHPSRSRCASPPPLLSPDDQPVSQAPPPVKVDQEAIRRCMRGTKTIDELWADIRNSPHYYKICPRSEQGKAHAEEKKVEARKQEHGLSHVTNKFKFGNSGRETYYSSVLGCDYSYPLSEFLKNRHARRVSAGEDTSSSKSNSKSWKFDPPTFKFKSGQDQDEEEEQKPPEPEQPQEQSKKRPNEDDTEWIQSPFCGDRYRKKDVDLLVAFADKYIKSECESTAKRRRLEQNGLDVNDESG
ncbi:hypothetical protein HJC23_008989 [Cyclotella cryptica]|uniref:Uncharacterized protein n=1 Tax=Cyclotella cryptica TaxID=29204 RepID=A0ABD3QZ16_9STRA